MRILSHLVEAVRSAAVYNPDVQVAPACILWPDKDHLWESVMPLVQTALPELLILGKYLPEKKTGPAIWLRCMLAGTMEDAFLPEGHTPVLYLPGIGRQDLRAVETCPDPLKPLAELQYRGTIWSQVNAKDWTLLAWLKSDQGGLGLDVAQDRETKTAMHLALHRLLDAELELLKGRHLDKDYFNTLLTGGDPIRDLLLWLDQGDAFQTARGKNEWKAFTAVCQSQLRFHPDNDGPLAGAALLAVHEGPWEAVWERFCEAPQRYPDIPSQIRKCRPPSDTIFWHTGGKESSGWPQWNDDQEKQLYEALMTLSEIPAHEAVDKLKILETHHGPRRELVWAQLGEAPLANALQHLAMMAEHTRTNLCAGIVDDLINGYQQHGWQVDDGMIQALAHVSAARDLEAVSTAIRAVYLPWAEASARHLQKIVHETTYPGGTCLSAQPVAVESGDCIFFVDGLRFDAGRRLGNLLDRAGFTTTQIPAWAALPSVTGTGKPAVAPIFTSDKIQEQPAGYNFELISHYQLHKAIKENGFQILVKQDTGDVTKKAWCEFGDMDHEGHTRGWKLATCRNALLKEIRDRIAALLAAGWKRVRVVTDHGWLLLPGGLPKTDLPAALVDTKWGRCASVKPGTSTDERLYPWYWNPHQHIALADGISCYKKGEEYAHGGLSLQECLTLDLLVMPKAKDQTPASLDITDVVWKGMRCTIAVDGNFTGLFMDIRTRAGNAQTSVALSTKPLKKNGTASVVVENEDMEGIAAVVVLVDETGALMAQMDTKIGGETA
jgi:hypothetical protein